MVASAAILIVNVSALASQHALGGTAYWTPRYVGTAQRSDSPSTTRGAWDLGIRAVSSSSYPTTATAFLDYGLSGSSGELHPLPVGLCYDQQLFFNGSEAIFQALDTSLRDQPDDWRFVVQQAKADLVGCAYTKYLQVAYSVENGQTGIFSPGTYKSCPFGCVIEMEYLHGTYTNVCIENICSEGYTSGTALFCDSTKGNDVYQWHTTWFCQSILQTVMECGDERVGKCMQNSEGFTCGGAPVSTGADSGSIVYALTAPANPDQPILVVAYQDGKVVAERAISGLSASEYVTRHGPIHADQAASLAESSGLRVMIAAAGTRATVLTTSTTASRPWGMSCATDSAEGG